MSLNLLAFSNVCNASQPQKDQPDYCIKEIAPGISLVMYNDEYPFKDQEAKVGGESNNSGMLRFERDEKAFQLTNTQGVDGYGSTMTGKKADMPKSQEDLEREKKILKDLDTELTRFSAFFKDFNVSLPNKDLVEFCDYSCSGIKGVGLFERDLFNKGIKHILNCLPDNIEPSNNAIVKIALIKSVFFTDEQRAIINKKCHYDPFELSKNIKDTTEIVNAFQNAKTATTNIFLQNQIDDFCDQVLKK